jgi:transposase InsO family protein
MSDNTGPSASASSCRSYHQTYVSVPTIYNILKRYRVPRVSFKRYRPGPRRRRELAHAREIRRRLPVAIQRVQTDHGNEFGTDFTWHLRDLGIAHRHISSGCPESNGKVERSHRTDEDEVYRRTTFRTAAELAAKLRRWEHEYNHRRLHLALAGQTPAERLCELRIRREPVQGRA